MNRELELFLDFVVTMKEKASIFSTKKVSPSIPNGIIPKAVIASKIPKQNIMNINTVELPKSTSGNIAVTSAENVNIFNENVDDAKSTNEDKSLSVVNYIENYRINPPAVERKPSHVLQAIPVYCQSPTEFYVNVVELVEDEPEKSSTKLAKFQVQMNKYYKSTAITSVIPQDLVFRLKRTFWACLFDDGNDLDWYRVRIADIVNAEKNQVLIEYIDYGNTAQVNVNELKPLRECDLEMPAQGIRCHLANVKAKDQDNGWSMDDKKYFANATSMAQLKLEIVDYPLTVSWGTSYKVIATNLDDADSTIAESLYESNIALRTSESVDIDGKVVQKLVVPSPALLPAGMESPRCADESDFDDSDESDVGDPVTRHMGFKVTEERNICKFFTTSAGCRRGNTCSYRHVSAADRK